MMLCTTIKVAASGTSFVRELLTILPEKYSEAYSALSPAEKNGISEIRIRAMRPCSFTVGERNVPMKDLDGRTVCSDPAEIEKITARVCDNSVYSYADHIKNGYIPYRGTRIGVCGTGINVDGIYSGQRMITSLSFRIPGIYPDAADKVLSYITEKGFEKTMGILAVSPPNCGKTTFLRALAAGLSDITRPMFGKRVCIIDERGELADKKLLSGCICDVINGIPKMQALEMAIRTMSPQVLVFDEIGSDAEAEALCKAYSGGIHIAASVHGCDISEVLRTGCMDKLFEKGIFKTVYLMKKNAALCPGEPICVSKAAMI